MDGQWAIENNRSALKVIVAGLVAMAGLGEGFTSPLWGFEAGLSIKPVARSSAEKAGEIAKQSGSPAQRKIAGPLTLTRRLHRAVLRLLRPAESAARRLIIALARGIELAPPPALRATSPVNRGGSALRAAATSAPTLRSGGLGPPKAVEGAQTSSPSPRPLTLALFDRLRRPARHHIPLRDLPRICVPGYTDRRSVPQYLPPSPTDPIDATRLVLRLDALAHALDDLPAHAKRFACWQARQISSGTRETRLSPLRAGRPPGKRTRNSRRPTHEVDEVLAWSHELAWWALEQPHPS